MVLPFKSLEAFDGVLELKLDFGVVWREFETDFVHELRCEGEVRPSSQVLVSLVLQLVLPSLVELDHHVSDISRMALVFDLLEHGLVHIIRHHREWLRLRWRRDLLQEVVTEGVLNPWVLQENGLRPHVKHTIVSLDCTNTHTSTSSS